MPDTPTRRSVVRLLGGVAGVAMWPLNLGGCAVGGGYSRGSYTTPTPDAPLTPPDDFYVNTNFAAPEVPTQWRLHLDGLVERPRILTLDEIVALPEVRQEVTLECIGNHPGGRLISAGAFRGVGMADLMALAGVSDRARGLMFVGLDGYPAFLPVSVLQEPGAMVVTHLGDAPLTFEHGSPLRALIPGRYGMFNIKWLDSITATREFATYGSLGELASFVESMSHVRSRIDSVVDGSVVPLGEAVLLSGLAVTPGRGVLTVELDDGTGYRPCDLTFNQLEDPHSPFLWSLWSTSWVPQTEGEVWLTVRATDATGESQDEAMEFPYDGGALHRVRVEVRAG